MPPPVPATRAFVDVSLSPAPRGLFRLEVRRRDRLVETVEGENLVVDAAREAIAHLVGGAEAGRQVTQLGVGSDGTAASAGNTGLSLDAFLKPLDGAPTYPLAGQVQFAFSLGPAEANGLSIAEFGLLTASGALFARKTRITPLAKTPDLTLSGTWLLLF